MSPGASADLSAWLATRPSLDDLRAAFPQEWEAVLRDVGELLERKDARGLRAYVLMPRAPAPATVKGLAREHWVLRQQVRRQMASEAMRAIGVMAATGVREGKVRFDERNGTLAQNLLFREGLERKPVSMREFRKTWRKIDQRDYLMPLVEPQGIYCFYSAELIERLARLVAGRSCLEVAAGDGTLSRFLTDAGVAITATDDHSWSHSVRFGADVLREDAAEAVRRRAPQVVVCSWPPAGNPFERVILAAPSVELYVVIASRHRFGSGDWDAYEGQDAFTFAEEPELSELVLPPEIDPAVYLFRRR